MQPFEPERFYRASDPELRVIATAGTLNQWRFHGRGPAYVKFGKRVLYRGTDLNEFVAANTVRPDPATQSPQAATA